MPILIDCYNLLHTTMPAPLAGLNERGLCEAIGRSAFAGDRAVIVCDGKVKPGRPAASPVAGVKLVYSGPTQSADDVIMAMIEKDSAPRRLIVVSNDHAIQRAANRRKAHPMTCEAFIGALSRPGDGGSGAARPTRMLTEDEVEGWLEEFELDGDKPIDPRKPWWEGVE